MDTNNLKEILTTIKDIQIKLKSDIEKVGWRNLGEVFAYPSIIPPIGAYLLNGQTIENCAELYPQFWEWLIINAGEMIEVPVYKPWTMPALTADGTLGGSEYAVEASGPMTSSDYAAYKSFDGSHGGAKTFACLNNVKSGSITWYSPVKLKISSLFFQNATAVTTAELVKEFEIFGSNDNQTWYSLTTGTVTSTGGSATQTIVIPESKYTINNPGYQYLKIEVVNGGGEDIEFPEITIYGQEYLYTNYTGSSNILTLTNEAYEYTLARAGVCGGFVIDSIAGSVRLPTLVNGTLWGANGSNIGQSLAAGLPDHRHLLFQSGGDNLVATTNSFAAASRDTGGAAGYVIGKDSVQKEPTIAKSGLAYESSIYGSSDTVQPTAIRVSWCIQVFNAATALSEQESAQLTSLMQLKAQIDLANVNENIDFIIKHEEATDGSWWYDLYRSGKVEQGGIITDAIGGAARTLTLPVEMANSNFLVFTTNLSFNSAILCCPERNETSFQYRINSNISGTVFSWMVKGYAATE